MNTTLIKTAIAMSATQRSSIEVSMPYGGGECFYVMVDNYFQGSIVSSLDGWLPNIKSRVLTGDDLGVIMDMVNELYPHPANKVE